MKIRHDENNYEDIIDLPHPTSSIHPRMSMRDRAAQFAPFAALTGHSDAINETARLTDQQLELDEDSIFLIDRKLQEIKETIDQRHTVTIVYFVPDEKKCGGKYVECMNVVKKIDEVKHIVVMENDKVIPIEYICDIL